MKVEPVTLVREYSVQWVRSTANINELKRLRNLGWSYAKIAAHVVRTKSAVIARLKRACSKECRS